MAAALLVGQELPPLALQALADLSAAPTVRGITVAENPDEATA